ncbi:MAG: hypothetical protein E6K48_00620 [Gammaproteobacteria bacterium]|nr:MAG: hypothetical protein E6K48_00620 [Gammaproteobacteria bacterium]
MSKPRLSGGVASPAVRLLGLGVLLAIAAASAGQQDGEQRERERPPGAPRHLFICAGDQARQSPDFLAVVNFDETSAAYGKVIARAPLPEPGATGNEMHHIGLSADGTVVACGGLLSVLKAQKEIFFWNIYDPARPEFISAADPPLSSITDEFHPLPQGGFLVTMMGGATGHAPGRVAELDRHLALVAEHPANPPADGFNPHGIAVRPEVNLMVTSDFICPATTLNATAGSLDLRGSVRVWDFKRREILRTIVIPNAGGTIDVTTSPPSPRAAGRNSCA